MGTLRFRHDGIVTDLVVSPDGKRIATCANGRSAHLWDAATGKHLLEFRDHLTPRLALAMSPDWKSLATGDRHQDVHLWDVESGRKIAQLPKQWKERAESYNRGIVALGFTPDGRDIISVADNRTVRIRDVKTGRELARYDGTLWGELYTDPVTISPTGRHIALEYQEDRLADREIRVWDLAKREWIDRWPAENKTVCLTFSPDGKRLAAGFDAPDGGDGSAAVRDIATSKVVLKINLRSGLASSLCFSPDGRRLAIRAGYPKADLHVWDLETSREISMVAIPEGRPMVHGDCIAFLDPDRTVVVTEMGQPHTLRIFDWRTGKEVRPLTGHGRSVTGLGFLPDGRRLVTSGGEIRVWNARNGEALSSFGRSGDTPMALSPDRKRLARGLDSGTIGIWDVATGEVVCRFAARLSGIYALEFTPDGRSLLSVGGRGAVRAVSIWDVTTGEERRAWEIGDSYPGREIAVSPDGETMVFAGPNLSRTQAQVTIWELASGQQLTPFEPEGTFRVNDLCFSPGGRTLALATDSREVRLYEWPTGGSRLTIPHPGWVTSVAFSPDGRLLATANRGAFSRVINGKQSDAGNEHPTGVFVWDAFTGEKLHFFDGHRGGVTSLAFSPDGTRLASGSDDTTALAWDLTPVRAKIRRVGKPLGPERLAQLWSALGSDDAAKAYAAIGELADGGEPARKFLAAKLAYEPPDEGLLKKWIAELGDPRFGVREKATAELSRLGPGVVPHLRDALGKAASVEAKRRIEKLIADLGGDLRTGRAREVLGLVGE